MWIIIKIIKYSVSESGIELYQTVWTAIKEEDMFSGGWQDMSFLKKATIGEKLSLYLSVSWSGHVFSPQFANLSKGC